MEKFIQTLIDERTKLEGIIREAENVLRNMPEGTLITQKSGLTERYYHYTDAKSTHGRYICKEESQLIEDLVKKDYWKKILGIARDRYSRLAKMITKYEEMTFLDVYEKYSVQKRKYITPIEQPDSEYAEEWEKNLHKLKEKVAMNNPELYSGAPTDILTDRGEYVRSKSEKIIADKLYRMGIPYVYEVPFLINGIGYFKPDFIVLNVRTRREYLFEHFGMMDHPDYVENAIRKIETYTHNDIVLGDRLIATFETMLHPLNTKAVNEIITQYLL